QTRPPPQTRLSSLGSVGILDFRVCLLGVWGVDDALPRKPITLGQADERLGENRLAHLQLHVGCRKLETALDFGGSLPPPSPSVSSSDPGVSVFLQHMA